MSTVQSNNVLETGHGVLYAHVLPMNKTLFDALSFLVGRALRAQGLGKGSVSVEPGKTGTP